MLIDVRPTSRAAGGLIDAVVYERDRLYAEVWAEPVIKVAERYGVSGVALAKTCRRLGVPLPPRGYWAKAKVGKAPERPALPARKEGQPESQVSRYRIRPTQPPRPPELDAVAPVPVIGKIVVADVLTDPHPLVERTRRHLLQVKPAYTGLLPWTSKPCLDITVSPDSLDRALRIADALLKSMEAAGLRVEERILKPKGKRPPRRSIWETQQPCEPEERVTRVLCDDEWLEFAISERVVRHERPKPDPPPRKIAWDGTFYDERVPTTYTYEPTGMLSLAITNVGRLGVQTTWNDGKLQRLESRLTEFVSRLSAVALAVKLQRAEEERQRVAALEESERRRIAEIEAERRRWALQQHRWAEEEREKKLLGELDRWRLARDIREYVDDKVQLVKDHQDVGEMSLATRWELGWALRYARSVDPLTSLREQLHRLAADLAAQDSEGLDQ